MLQAAHVASSGEHRHIPEIALTAACSAISSRSRRQLIGNHSLVATCAAISSRAELPRAVLQLLPAASKLCWLRPAASTRVLGWAELHIAALKWLHTA